MYLDINKKNISNVLAEKGTVNLYKLVYICVCEYKY